MKKVKSARLVLSRTTVCVLADDQLSSALGARVTSVMITCGCPIKTELCVSAVCQTG